jgi:large-conductance mechanosensitive channel
MLAYKNLLGTVITFTLLALSIQVMQITKMSEMNSTTMSMV